VSGEWYPLTASSRAGTNSPVAKRLDLSRRPRRAGEAGKIGGLPEGMHDCPANPWVSRAPREL
jgi:hypothetical protein